MSRFKYSDKEKQINRVLNYQDLELKKIKKLDKDILEFRITETEELINSLGYSLDNIATHNDEYPNKVLVVPNWESLYKKAEETIEDNDNLESLFTQEELNQNELAVKMLNEEFNSLYRLDKMDVTLSAGAGLLASVIDILLVGVPKKTKDGLKAGPLSNYVREWFDKKFPESEMNRLANLKISKVPFDAQDNRYTKEYVDGLSAYYHRLLSLGHDPLLGLVFGVLDILTGRMTTIDKKGKIVSQIMENYSDRKEADIFSAIAKLIIHFKSDINTSMGLPVPLMALFNLLQFGNIGEAEQTIAEIVQGMYYEGYDFIHFCSMSIPTMIIEVIIRLGYGFKRIREGYSIKESVPISNDREKNPKLSTMLFIGHSIAASINAGKVYFSKDPLSINYSQWLVFIKYAYTQFKWVILKKPQLREKYIREKSTGNINLIYSEINSNFDEISESYVVIFE